MTQFSPPVIMGVLNVTPDSFSDGGRYLALDDAVKRGLQMQEEGAQLVDVGGESTRPGAQRVTEQVELDRVLPVIERLSSSGITVSIDTTRASVAKAALKAGATLINDVSGGKSDPEMFDVVAESGVPYVVMHWRAHSASMDSHAQYQDVTAEVVAELQAQIDRAKASGVAAQQIIVDPGLGFAKNIEHNWQLLANLQSIIALGFPLLIGASRKRFVAALVGGSDEEFKDLAGAAIAVYAVAAGAWGVRTHDPKGVAKVLRGVNA